MATPASDANASRRSDLGPADAPLRAERCVISLLAVDVVGSTRHIAGSDPEDAQSFFDGCFAHLRRAIEEAGGLLLSYEGDGGIAAFGWPQAHEDHADRALAAAWEIQHGDGAPRGPDGRPVRFRAGVNAGLVAVRELRRDGRPQLGAAGAAVHAAAKLQQCAAPGAVLVSAHAARLCRAGLRLSPHPVPAELAELIGEAFRLDARPEPSAASDLSRRYGSPLVGRGAELAELRWALARSRGAGRALALVGEAGIGKSRLAAAAAEEGAAGGARLLLFTGDARKLATPFAAPRELMRGLLRLPEEATHDELRAALARACRSALREDELGAIEALLAPRAPRRAEGAAPTGTRVARGLVEAFNGLALDRPTLLIVEDLQLVDAESRNFLQLLAEAAAGPLCLLITARPEAEADARAIVDAVLEVPPLPPAAMRELAERLWPDGEDAPATLDRLVARAEGVPLVLEELVQSVGGGGAEPQLLPQGVASLVHARLQRLTPGARSLAQALSLLGEGEEPELLGAVLDRRPEALRRDFEELERFAFARLAVGEAMRMRHQVIAEACADTVPRERRRELHRRAAAAIRAQGATLAGRHERLAFHAEGADELAEALEHLWQAAREARRSGAAASINLLFDRAMALVARLGPAAEARYVDFVLMAFASMLQLGEFEKMNAHLPRVIALARRDGRPERVASTLAQLGMIRWFEGHFEEGLCATEEGLAIARELRSPALTYSNMIMRSNNLHCLGRVERAIAEQRELCAMLAGDLETARLGAPSLPQATVLAYLSWFMLDRGDHREALGPAEAALAAARRASDRYAEVLARTALGRALTVLHRNREAIECLAEARLIAERDGYDAVKASLVGRAAIALSREGRAREALDLVADCRRRRLDQRTGCLEVFALHLGHAEALLRAGDAGQGLAEVDAALTLARGIGDPCRTVEALRLRIWFLSSTAPDDPRLAADLKEHGDLCHRHRLLAWPLEAERAEAPA